MSEMRDEIKEIRTLKVNQGLNRKYPRPIAKLKKGVKLIGSF